MAAGGFLHDGIWNVAGEVLQVCIGNRHGSIDVYS